jgi:WD40 repeat protein
MVCAQRGRHCLIDVAAARECRRLAAPPGDRNQAAFNRDGLLLACGGSSGVRFWNLTDPAPAVASLDLAMPQQSFSVAFHPDGTCLIVATTAGLWRVPITERLREAPQPDNRSVRHMRVIPIDIPLLTLPRASDGRVEISADGMRAALGQYGRESLVLSLRQPTEPIILSGSVETMFISMSPDMKWIATGTWKGAGDHRVRIWNARTGKLVVALPVPQDADVAFSPDGRWLVTSSTEEYRFWEVGSWQKRHAITREADSFGRFAFAPDSRTMAIARRRWGVQLVDANTGAELATIDDEDMEFPLAFSPDGSLLVTRGQNETLRLWDLRRIREQLKEMGLDWSAPPLPPRSNDAVDLTVGGDTLLDALQSVIRLASPATRQAAP